MNNYVQCALAFGIVISYYLINNASMIVYLLFLVTLLIMAYPGYLQWKRHNMDIAQLEDDIKKLEELWVIGRGSEKNNRKFAKKINFLLTFRFPLSHKDETNSFIRSRQDKNFESDQ